MISPILLLSFLGSTSALTVQRTTVRNHGARKYMQVEDLKSSGFSFTNDVLRAWSPEKKAEPRKTSRTRRKLPLRTDAKNGSVLNQEAQTNTTSSSLRTAGLHDSISEVHFVNQSYVTPRLLNTQSAQVSRAPPAEVSKLQSVARSESRRSHGNAGELPNVNNVTDVVASLALTGHAVSFHARQTLKSQDFVAGCFAVGVLIIVVTGCMVVFVFSDSDEGAEKKEDVQASLKTILELRAAIKDAEGSWAENYRSADDNRKTALEMLFRCDIIPAQEFAHSRIAQSNIDECIWIATVMLRQRSLEAWVAHSLEAQVKFEENFTACHKERHAVNDTHQSASSASQPQGFNPHVVRQRSTEEAVLARDSRGENLLVTRCREIMNSARLPRSPRPWHFLSATPPITPGRS